MMLTLACSVGCELRHDLDSQHANAVGRFEPAELRDAGPNAYRAPCTRAEFQDDTDAGRAHPGKLDLTFTPAVPPGVVGHYDSPIEGHVAAAVVWIEDENGALVKTVDFWGGLICFGALVEYTSRFVGGCTVDVITRPTLHGYDPVSTSWDGKGLHGKVVPDGNYTLVIDVQIDEELPHHMELFKVPFTKGSMAYVITSPPMPPQTDLTLTYTPE